MWLNKVGTFEAAHHMLGSRLAVWSLLFADDGNLFAEMEHLPRSLLGFLLVMEILGVSWKKVRGGLESDFVGYWLDVRNYCMGLSEGRAAWIQRWATEEVMVGSVLVQSLSEGLGRLGFAY